MPHRIPPPRLCCQRCGSHRRICACRKTLHRESENLAREFAGLGPIRGWEWFWGWVLIAAFFGCAIVAACWH